jgi:hypothetical protein
MATVALSVTPSNPQAGYPVKSGDNYVLIAASKTASAFAGPGGVGALGDFLAGILVVPATTSLGAISITDGGGSAISLFTGGAGVLADIKPFYIPIGVRSTSGGWAATTSNNGSIIAIGSFT